MGVLLDLTSRTVAFISLIQDIIIQQEDNLPPISNSTRILLLDSPIDTILAKIKDSNKRKELFQQRTIELIWVSKKEPDRLEVEKEFYRRSVALLGWLQDRMPELHTGLLKFITLTNAGAATNDAKGNIKKIYYSAPAPHQWREAIRAYLYAVPKDRVSLAKALDYLPLLIILALGRAHYPVTEQRLLQEWYTSEDITDKLLTRRELAVLNRWRLDNLDEKAEDLLLNDQELLKKLLDEKIPLPFEVIFRDELQEISLSRMQRRPHAESVQQHLDPLRFAENMHIRAIAFSGGGIRSATFNLGILQGLAQHGILHKFDYLSTVSGGGYIGSWLAAWIKRNGSVFKAANRLNPEVSRDPRGDEVAPIRWLRMYSNYLTPITGIMSTDSWTMGMTWLRNTLLNQLIILLLLCTILSFGTILLFWWQELYLAPPTPGAVLLYSSLLLAPAVLLTGWGMHLFDSKRFPPNPFKPKQVKILTNLLLVLALAAAYFTSGLLYPDDFSAWWKGYTLTERMELLCPAGVAAWVGLLLVALLGRYDLCVPSYNQSPYRHLKKLLSLGMVVFFSALAAATGLLLLALVWEAFTAIPDIEILTSKDLGTISKPPVYLSRLGFTIGVPLILEVISLTVVMRMALLGKIFPDERREWWGRLGAQLHRLAFIWVIITGCALGGVWLVDYFVQPGSIKVEVAAAGGWLALVGTAVRLAFNSNITGENKPGGMRASILDTFVRIAPYLFGLGFLLIAANIVYGLIKYLSPVTVPLLGALTDLELAVALFSCLLIITLILVWRVGVNEFSMHHFYRNRLVRAYLGASRRYPDRARTSNAFTGLDKEDDLKLTSLTCSNGYCGPYLIINTTLNASNSTDLDRQDRKAESFVFTPQYCGFDIARTSASANSAGQSYDYGYRPTRQYAYEGGPSLGTALAISGAAANPGMGHHSSPATAFLLTAFNARLGWWMGNPRRTTWRRSDPRYGLAYIISDLIGRTSTHDRFVCLSDGGHFDNMGLYELIRRRCRLILLGDGEQDDRFTCEGLANAIRRCRIDFGVEICIDVSPITNRGPHTKISKKHFALGNIWYPGDPANKPSGVLLYLKSSLTGDEPIDIREYAHANPKFPHQSTSDQFFDESQFESYRRLGLHIIEAAMLDANIRKVL